MDTDGAKTGFELNITEKISKLVNIPVIAKWWSWNMEHIKEAFEFGAVLQMIFQFSF